MMWVLLLPYAIVLLYTDHGGQSSYDDNNAVFLYNIPAIAFLYFC